MFFSSVNSFIRQEDSKPVVKCIGHIETIGDLADVLQFAKELLLVSYRIERLFHLKAVSLLIRIVVRQELGIPVVQVARMKDTFTFGLNNPRHAAVCAA